MADQVIKWYHFALGHCRTQRLYDTISNRFYLRGLNEMCKSFVCPMHCNALKLNVMKCNAMKCNAMKLNEIKCNAMQCNAMKCNEVQ